MPLTIKSGLVQLVTDVRAFFAANDLDDVGVHLGWRKRDASGITHGDDVANRVVFVPSALAGKGGKIAAPHQPGERNADEFSTRTLRTWERAITVCVWAVDSTDPDDEEKQISAVETLFEWTVRAVHASAYANAVWGDAEWTAPDAEHIYGRELVVGLTLKHPIFDVPKVRVFPEGEFVRPDAMGIAIDPISARIIASGNSDVFTITASGSGFFSPAQISVDGVDVSPTALVFSPTSFRFTTPALRVGTHRVSITTPAGTATRSFVVTIQE